MRWPARRLVFESVEQITALDLEDDVLVPRRIEARSLCRQSPERQLWFVGAATELAVERSPRFATTRNAKHLTDPQYGRWWDSGFPILPMLVDGCLAIPLPVVVDANSDIAGIAKRDCVFGVLAVQVGRVVLRLAD